MGMIELPEKCLMRGCDAEAAGEVMVRLQPSNGDVFVGEAAEPQRVPLCSRHLKMATQGTRHISIK
jgi:hypothetical protein